MQQMRYPCDFFQFKPTFPIMVWPRFWNDFRSQELLRSKWENAGSQRSRLWCWSLVTGNNPGRSSSDQHLDTQEQGHLGWSSMQGCWPRLPASPPGIWHDHKAHQNLDATPGNRQGGGNQNRCPKVSIHWPNEGVIVEMVFSVALWSDVSCTPSLWNELSPHYTLKRVLVKDVVRGPLQCNHQRSWPLANGSSSHCLSLHIYGGDFIAICLILKWSTACFPAQRV